MEREEGIGHYNIVDDIMEEGEESKRKIEADPSKSVLTKIIEKGEVEVRLVGRASIVLLARWSLLAPAMRAAILIGRKVKKLASGGISHGAE